MNFPPVRVSFSLHRGTTVSVWIAGGCRGHGWEEGEAKAAEMEILYLLKQVIFQPALSSKVHHWIIKRSRLRTCFGK